MKISADRNGPSFHATLRSGLCLLVILAVQSALGSIELGQPMPQFTTRAVRFVDGKKIESTFDNIKERRVTAYVFVGTKCPATNAYVDRLKQIEKEFQPNGVEFVYFHPNREDTPDITSEFHAQKGLGGWLVDDRGGGIAKRFGALRTTEVMIVDKEERLIYHGAIDNSRDPSSVTVQYVKQALDEHLAGKPVTMKTSQVQA